jgi:hypothetical protein
MTVNMERERERERVNMNNAHNKRNARSFNGIQTNHKRTTLSLSDANHLCCFLSLLSLS